MQFEWDERKATGNRRQHRVLSWKQRRPGIMRKEYDLGKLKVKRRGPLPAFRDAAGRPMKVRITITLDQDR